MRARRRTVGSANVRECHQSDPGRGRWHHRAVRLWAVYSDQHTDGPKGQVLHCKIPATNSHQAINSLFSAARCHASVTRTKGRESGHVAMQDLTPGFRPRGSMQDLTPGFNDRPSVGTSSANRDAFGTPSGHRASRSSSLTTANGRGASRATTSPARMESPPPSAAPQGHESPSASGQRGC
jgi:hypothetical protein